jgi:hypothetical protein
MDQTPKNKSMRTASQARERPRQQCS